MGAFISLLAVGTLTTRVDSRILIGMGFLGLAWATASLSNINLDIAAGNIRWPVLFSGVAMGLIFVPLTITTMGALPNEQMGNAAGVFNLMRNIGGSIGIALATTWVARGAQVHQAYLVEHLTPYHQPFQQAYRATAGMLGQYSDPATGAQQSYGVLYGQLQQQAALSAYVDTFWSLALLCLLCAPIVLVFRKTKAGGHVAAH